MPAPLLCTVSGSLFGPSGAPLEGVKIKAYVTSAFTDGSGNYIPAGVLASTVSDADGLWSLDVLQTASLGRSVTFEFNYPLSNNQSQSVKYAAVIPDAASADFADLVDLSTGAAIIATTVSTDELPEGDINLYFTAERATAAAQVLIDSLAGVADGLATLDADGKVPAEQLPPIDSLPDQAGHAGEYLTTDGTAASWAPVSAGVSSVNGETGDVVLSTSDVAEGSNQYYTPARFDASLASKSTDDLAEGGNLYYTDARATDAAEAAIAAVAGQASGLATLDGAGKIPSAQLPSIAVTETFVVADEAAMLALTAQVGDVAVRSDESKTYILQSEPASTLGNWVQLQFPGGGAGAVTSVNGQTGTVSLDSDDVAEGSTNLYFTNTRAQTASVVNTMLGGENNKAPSVSLVGSLLSDKVNTARTINGYALTSDVTLAKGDVGLGNVDNTSDANKPVSTATQTALNAKVPTTTTVNGNALSSNVTVTPSQIPFTPTTSSDWATVPTQVQQALDYGASRPKVINLMTNWTSYTPTFTGIGTPSSVAVFWRRVGDTIEVQGSFTTGTTSSANFSISLPTGLTLATSRLSAANSVVGSSTRAVNNQTAPQSVLASPASSTSALFAAAPNAASLSGASPQPANGLYGSSESVSLYFKVPIAEWTQANTVNIFDAGDYGWTNYTPTFTSLGTVSGVSFWHKRVGDTLKIQGRFTSGTASGAPAQFTLPAGLVIDSTKLASLRLVGTGATDEVAVRYFTILATGGTSYLTVGVHQSGQAGLTPQNANTWIGSGTTMAFTAEVPITGWSTFPFAAAWAPPRSSIALNGYGGYGSTATRVLYFGASSVTGTGMTLTTDTTNGARVTINEDGIYSVAFSKDTPAGSAGYVSITKNATGTDLTGDIRALSSAVLLMQASTPSVSGQEATPHVTWTGLLTAGDIIRFQADGNATSGTTGSSVRTKAIITKVNN